MSRSIVRAACHSTKTPGCKDIHPTSLRHSRNNRDTAFVPPWGVSSYFIVMMAESSYKEKKKGFFLTLKFLKDRWSSVVLEHSRWWEERKKLESTQSWKNIRTFVVFMFVFFRNVWIIIFNYYPRVTRILLQNNLVFFSWFESYCVIPLNKKYTANNEHTTSAAVLFKQ